jgi:hypothetical protein
MKKQRDPDPSVPFSQARQRFEAWRKRGRPGRRIPDELWSLAVGLARKHGINPIARMLGLDYYALKKKLNSSHEEEQSRKFIELFPAGTSSSRIVCTIELEDGRGAKMRICVDGPTLPDLVALTRVFRRVEG